MVPGTVNGATSIVLAPAESATAVRLPIVATPEAKLLLSDEIGVLLVSVSVPLVVTNPTAGPPSPPLLFRMILLSVLLPKRLRVDFPLSVTTDVGAIWLLNPAMATTVPVGV